MYKRRSAATFAMGLLLASNVGPRVLAADDEGVSARFELNNSWDSNFSRSPESDMENITQAVLNLSFSESYKKQTISSGIDARQYWYRNNDDLDTAFLTGRFKWQGELAKRLLLELNATRVANPIDPLEFRDKDVVTRDDLVWRAGFGSLDHSAVYFGQRNTQQDHDASLRRFLDFDEQELFVEIQIRNGNNLVHTLSAHEGERSYINSIETDRILDFSYKQFGYKLDWRASDKSELSFGLAHVTRNGDQNRGGGSLVDAQWTWQLTHKLSMQTGFSLRQPALGEEVNSLVKDTTTSIEVGWQITDIWRLETAAVHSDQRISLPLQAGRTQESLVRLRPLTIVFSHSDVLAARFGFELSERNSRVSRREYDGLIVNIGLQMTL